MSKDLLERFFKENRQEKSEIPTAPAIMHFHIMMDSHSETNIKMSSLMNELVFKSQPEREKTMLEERAEIESAAACGQIIRFMRRGPDSMNQRTLIAKALEFEDELVPEIIRMLKTSLNDCFIETAIRILAQTGKDVAENLTGCYSEIQNPYARAQVLVLLGFKLDETSVPWFIGQYGELKKSYPHESYCDGPYYALAEIDARFYPVKRRKK